MACEITKKTRGRQKIEMKRIENGEDKLITFSKRRSGIYKKASELAILTGAKVGFVVYSPAGKPYSFGHPSMEAIINRFLGRQGEATNPLMEAHRLVRIDELNNQHNELLEKLDAEKEKEKELKEKMGGVDRNGWWDTPIEDLTMQQISERDEACKNLQLALINNVREMTGGDFGATSSSSINLNVPQQFPHNYGQWPTHM